MLSQQLSRKGLTIPVLSRSRSAAKNNPVIWHGIGVRPSSVETIVQRKHVLPARVARKAFDVAARESG